MTGQCRVLGCSTSRVAEEQAVGSCCPSCSSGWPVSDDTEGQRVRVSGRVYDLNTRAPVVGATLDVWQAATNGFYENQDPNQPDYNPTGSAFATERWRGRTGRRERIPPLIAVAGG